MDTELNDLVATVMELPPYAVTDEVGAATEGGWTSLRHVRLMAAVQNAYGVDLTPREMRSARSVGRLRAILRDKGVPA